MAITVTLASTDYTIPSPGEGAWATTQSEYLQALATVASSAVVSVGTFGSTPNSAGASVSGSVLTLQPASATQPGGVSTTTQTFAGNKTFSGTIGASNFSGSSSGTNTGDVTLTAVGASPSANGASLSGQALTLQPADSTRPGLVTAGTQTFGGAKTFASTIAASNFSGTFSGTSSGTNTGDLTLTAVGSSPSANGASLSGQALTLQPADGSQPGLMTAGTQTIGGAKTFNSSVTVGTNLTVDTNTFAVNGTSNMVGIGTTSPSETLDVSSGGAVVRGALAGVGAGIGFDFHSGGTPEGFIDCVLWGTSFYKLSLQALDLVFSTGTSSASERGRFKSNGDFVVDTSTLYVDAANNRVGVGTASPAQALDVTGAVALGGKLIASSTAPTISSGFGTSPSITAPAGTAAFKITVGTGGVDSTGVISLPTATTGWVVNVQNISNPDSSITSQTASSTTSASVKNYDRATGAATAWTAGDVLLITAMAY